MRIYLNDILSSESLYRITFTFYTFVPSWLLKRKCLFIKSFFQWGQHINMQERIHSHVENPVLIHSSPCCSCFVGGIIYAQGTETDPCCNFFRLYILHGNSRLFLVGIYSRWLETFCRVLKYRWKNFKFAHFGIILKQKCYCWIWACDGWMSVSMKWHKSV